MTEEDAAWVVLQIKLGPRFQATMAPYFSHREGVMSTMRPVSLFEDKAGRSLRMVSSLGDVNNKTAAAAERSMRRRWVS